MKVTNSRLKNRKQTQQKQDEHHKTALHHWELNWAWCPAIFCVTCRGCSSICTPPNIIVLRCFPVDWTPPIHQHWDLNFRTKSFHRRVFTMPFVWTTFFLFFRLGTICLLDSDICFINPLKNVPLLFLKLWSQFCYTISFLSQCVFCS